MILASRRRTCRWLLAVTLCGAALPSHAETAPAVQVASNPAVEAYIRARRAYEDEASAYWQAVVDKRRGRNAKRRNSEDDRTRRLRADAAAGLYRTAAAAGLSAAAARSGPAGAADPGHRGFPQGCRRRNTASCRTGRKATPSSSRTTPRWPRPRASPATRRSAFMPSKPAETGLTTARPASSAIARTRGRSRRRWATTSCSAPTLSVFWPSTVTSSSPR